MPTLPARLPLSDHEARPGRRLRGHLEREGFLAREADDGQAVLACLQRELPHPAVFDFPLPAPGGLEQWTRGQTT